MFSTDHGGKEDDEPQVPSTKPKTSGVSFEDTFESGPSLAFVAYPKTLSTMPLSYKWSALFATKLILDFDGQLIRLGTQTGQ
ncbi:Sodium and chloride-dependent GABA transporter 3 [Taenia solium]|eukprot:TsM_000832000 transcript=TsM_000832000 gene=TsM_000832000